MTADLLLLNAFALAIGLAVSGKRIRSERTASSNLPFSDAVWHGNTLYLCGHLGLDPKTGRPPATADEEARLVMDGVKRTLESAGLTMEGSKCEARKAAHFGKESFSRWPPCAKKQLANSSWPFDYLCLGSSLEITR
ncbi:MAG: RidA family protein [Terriglobales bacterium]